MLPKNQNRILHVVPKQKELPYTVTPIGDKIALERWKVDQIIKEEEYQAKMAPIRAERAKEAAEIVAINKTWLDNIKDSIKSAISDTFFKH